MPGVALRDIPTNLIMGFLGVGKTTAILHLLSNKPEGETWAVLVNEFGKIGIDGAIYHAHGIAVKEIPGGCMCCAAGAPLQVNINRLIKSARPDRLLIEPSGIGHPYRVLETLRDAHFQSVLKLQAAICLVNPHLLSDPRYAGNENFIDQIAVSDVLVANKTDLANEHDMQAFDQLSATSSPPKALIAETTHGQIQTEWLDFPNDPTRKARHPYHHQHGATEQFQSCGWVLPEDSVFSYDALAGWLGNLSAERIKGILTTDKGPMIINETRLTAVNDHVGNQLEILARELNCPAIKKQLKDLLVTGDW